MFSIALGTSFAQKLNKTKDVTMTIIGDGGMEEGIVYETLIWLHFIFCNNFYM